MFTIFKKRTPKELTETDEREYLIILDKIKKILDISNQPQAISVQKLINLMMKKNYIEFNKYINSVDFWGGSGAVWEVCIENNDDAKNFECQIILLIDLMEKTNYVGRVGIKPIRKLFKNNQNKSE